MTDSLGTSSERAEFYSEVADEAEASEPTTFTSEEVYEATARLSDVLGIQLRNADTIRGRRQRVQGVRERRPRWVRRVVRSR